MDLIPGVSVVIVAIQEVPAIVVEVPVD